VAGFATTASVNTLSSSINQVVKDKMNVDGVVSGSSQLTSSYDNRYVLSGSITQTTWDNIANKPADIVSSSIQIINLGFATTSSVNDLQSKTGSYISTSSFGAYSSSINTFTSSATTRLNTIESVTGSFASTSSVNNLQSVTGSYASTGSNQFNGNQSISGSITSNGTITAQTLVVQTVTSSIEFVTGSTRNGSIAANTHQFTGSVLMSGSLNLGGNLTVGNSLSYGYIYGPSNQIFGSIGANTTWLNTGTSGLRINNAADNATLAFVSNAGNVGIGTTSPSGSLHIIGTNATNRGQLSIQSNDTNNAARVSFYYHTTLQGNIGTTSGDFYSEAVNNYILYAGGSERVRITNTGVVHPGANGTQDLGTSSLRWATIYTSDLSLSNGIGDYTIVEGEEKLYLYNNKNNKVYSFVLQEEDPLTATPKKS
jgi:hypothetical protein